MFSATVVCARKSSKHEHVALATYNSLILHFFARTFILFFAVLACFFQEQKFTQTLNWKDIQ